MATVPFTVNQSGVDGCDLVQWVLGPNDDGAPFRPGFTRGLAGCVQAEGTFAGAAVTMEKTNETAWRALADGAGAAISLNAAGTAEFSTAALAIRPKAGAVTSVTVTVALRG